MDLFKGDSKYFDVKRVNRFKVKNIRSVYKQDPVAQSNAVATIDMSKVQEVLTTTKATKGTFRVEIYVHLAQSNNNPLYSNTWVVKGRPWTFEFSATSTEEAGDIVDKVIKMITKFKLFTMDTEQLKATKKDTKLVLTAQDPYQIFSKVELQYFDPSIGTTTGCCTPRGEYAPVENYGVTDVTTITPGNEGFGTFEWIMRNLRLPTAEQTRWNALYQDDRPMVGATYTQYTLEYCENRGILGGDAVGEETKSVTTHVFFVNQAVKDQFEAALTAADITTLAPTAGAVEVDAAEVAAELTAFKAEVEKTYAKKVSN
nr:MAG TPA: hypothetical protein [Bacteriophage sp.]